MPVKRTRYVTLFLTVTVGLSTCGRLEVLEGASVTLDITSGQVDKENLKILEWTFNQTTIVEYFDTVYVGPFYKGRAVFYDDNFSLLLKNLTRSDTGYYKAEIRSHTGLITTVADYYISVLVNVGLSTCGRMEVLEGASVTLNITTGQVDKENLKILEWTFNQTTIVEYFDTVYVGPFYKGRAVFYEDNFSLLLKNLKRNDTGYYKAEIRSHAGLIMTVAEYCISVLEIQRPEPEPVNHPRTRIGLLAAAFFACSCSVVVCRFLHSLER